MRHAADYANAEFRRSYSDAKKAILKDAGPVIVASGSDLWLIRGNDRQRRNTISLEYNVLKTIDHIALALFVLLDRHVGAPLSGETQAALRELDERSIALENSIAGRFSPETRQRLIAMLESSDGFMQAALAAHQVSRRQLDAFIKSSRERSMSNVYDAVVMELSAIDEAVQDFRKQLTPEEWSKIHVVVTGSHMPRDQERRMQYFQLLLNEKREGDRLIYLENSDDIDKALDLLAIHEVDRAISRAYFKGDEWQMHRDLLSEAATKYLKLHPPAK